MLIRLSILLGSVLNKDTKKWGKVPTRPFLLWALKFLQWKQGQQQQLIMLRGFSQVFLLSFQSSEVLHCSKVTNGKQKIPFRRAGKYFSFLS